MNGMGGMSQAISSLLQAMGITLPPWGMPAVALFVMLLFMPLILKNMKTTRARKILKRSAFESGAQRQLMEEQALALVLNNPVGLMSLAEACIQQGRYALARKALRFVPADNRRFQWELHRLRGKMAAVKPTTAAAAASTIAHLQQEGFHAEAQQHLEEALRRWPGDELLLPLMHDCG